MNDDNALLAVFERNQFYRSQYFRALGAFGLSLVIILILGWVLAYVIRHPMAPLYFATDNVGRLINVIPVDRPNMSDEDVGAWAVNVVQKTNTYDYVNYRSQLQSSQKYFTELGWKAFLVALKSSLNLEALTVNSMIFDAKVVGEPKLVTKGLLNGAYAWQFEMPMLWTYMSPPYDEKSTFANAKNVSITIKRLPILQSSDGLGILQVIISAASSNTANQSTMTSMPSG